MGKISGRMIQALRSSTADAADAARRVYDAACVRRDDPTHYEAARAAYDAARAAAVRASVREAVEAYKEALAAERLQPENRLVHGFTVYQSGSYDGPTSGEWRRLAALLVSEGDPYAPWGAYGAFFVTRSSGWQSGSPEVVLWANRRPLVRVVGSAGSHVGVARHGKAAVRLWRERRATDRREAAARNEMFQPLLARLDDALAVAPLGALRYVAETGDVPASLYNSMPRGIELCGGQQGGSVLLTLSDGRRARFGAARRIKRALAEARVDGGAARCATLPAVWRRGFDADL
jgi:hypothetical protein